MNNDEHIKEVSIVKHPRSNYTIPPFALCINDATLLYLSTSVPLSRLLFWVYFLAMWGNLRTARLNNELVVLHFSNLNSLSPRIAFHCPKPYLFNPRLIQLSSSGEKGIFFFLLGGLNLFLWEIVLEQFDCFTCFSGVVLSGSGSSIDEVSLISVFSRGLAEFDSDNRVRTSSSSSVPLLPCSSLKWEWAWEATSRDLFFW